MIITIGREHGSSGHEIARLLAKELGLMCYDKEIVDEAAANSQFSKEIFHSYDEKRVSTYIMPTPHFGAMHEGVRLNLQVASAQFDAIRSLADKGDGIFVGRCADYILRNRHDLVKVFIRGDIADRVETMMVRKNLGYDQARKLIKEVDKDRASYYRYYTDQVWGESENYDLIVNSSKVGVDGSVKVIRAYLDAIRNKT